jgi:hypothetical protein
MPSPIGHALAGLTAHALLARDRDQLWSPARASVAVAAALSPDLDLLFRFVDGRNHHGNETHGIGFALIVALLAAAVSRLRGWDRPLPLALLVGASWLTHTLLDYLNRDTNPPIGIMALWPLSSGHFKFPWPIFLDIGRTLEWATVRNNALAAALEAAVLVPILVSAWRLRSGRED